ncbi:Photosystem I assembly protein Ycf3 [Acaryochloris thomasi RCC1774]|uniref:Photosystem I assembly protein Ycf3 n=1 Tax=Acaryochloris thomasi RCC1774 TaxID=1764569 RepID=A0A2W1JJT0_9CYAN|nr:CHAT domain-containing protein [Acaryochloris thomasi]PZD73690.1 Photosystem I assembly protein Ycf3 [Acaryochloris thomasi RCC1774]
MDKVSQTAVSMFVASGLLLCPDVTFVLPAAQAQEIQSVDLLLEEGDLHLQKGQLFKALTAYEQASLQLRNQAEKAQTLIKTAKIHSGLLQESQALETALQALAIYETLSDPLGKAEALTEVGDAYLDLEHNQKALEILQQALTILQREKRPTQRIRQGLAETLNDLGRVHRNLEQYPQANRFFKQSLALHRRMGNQFEVGRLKGAIGGTYVLQGQRTQAVPSLKMAQQTLAQVLADSQRSGNRTLEAQTIYHMGLNALLEGQQGLEQFEQAIALFRDLNYRVREADALSTLGIYHQIRGQFVQQLQYEQQAQAIFQTTGEPIYTNNSLSTVGQTLKRLGRYPEAIKTYEQVLVNYRKLGQSSPQRDRYPLQVKMSQVLARLGAAQAKLGQYSQAIKTLEGRLSPYTVVLKSNSLSFSDRKQMVNLLQQLGDAHNQIDQYPQALTYLNQALKLSQPLQDPLASTAIYSSLGNVYARLGQNDKSLDLYRQALQLYQQALTQTAEQLGHNPSEVGQQSSGSSTGQNLLRMVQPTGNNDLKALALSTLGAEYAEQGQPSQALQTYQQALGLYRRAGDRPQESLTLTSIGLLHLGQKRYPQAIESFQQKLALSRSLDNRSDTARTLSLIGDIHYQQKRYAQAEPMLREAADLWDSLQPGLSDQDRVTQRDSIVSTFDALQQTLIARDQPKAALEISERGRARAFVELLASRSAKVAKRQQPVEPLTIKQIQQVAQDQQATLVEYSIVDGQIFIWVVQPTGAIHLVRVDRLSGSLEKLIRNSRTAIGARGRGQIAVVPTSKGQSDQSQKSLQELHRLLIAPVAQYLPTDPEERVIFIPEGELFLAPFAAFQDRQGQALLQQHTVVTAPSIQVLTLTRQQQQRLTAGGEALIVGNPTMPRLAGQSAPLLPLPGAEKEAIAIAKMLNTQAITGSQATKTKIAQQMPKARLIHFATHGLLDNIQGSNDVQNLEIPGAIALAPDNTGEATDGFLTASDIGEMELTADLVVLSACDTGGGRITGDGVIGLSRSFLSSGVPSVVVSLWKVPDESTALLMTTFYQELQRGADKAQALRQAMLTTKQKYPNPLDWAAFTLIGEAE